MLLKRVTSRFMRPWFPFTSTSERGPVAEVGSEWYDHHFAKSQGYAAHYSQSSYYFLWCVIADRLRRLRCERVLEIGCGPGQLASLLMDQSIVREYVGLDFSAQAIDMARRNVPSGRFVVGDARSEDIYNTFEYDVLLCTEVLEHIEDDLAVVSRFIEGKRCICSVPSFAFPSHVRFFANAGEVAARYGAFFDDMDVATFKSPSYQKDQFYLFDGVRNSNTSSS